MFDLACNLVFDQQIAKRAHLDLALHQQLRSVSVAVLTRAADTRAKAERARAITRRLRGRPASRHGVAARSASSRRGRPGGLARAVTLGPERRAEIARLAARARWQRANDSIGSSRPPDPRLGGLARARALTPERRREIARTASAAARRRRV